MRTTHLAGLWLGLTLAAAPVVAQSPAPELQSAPAAAAVSPAPSATYPRHAVSANPLGWLIGFYAAEYELALSRRVSVFVQPGFARGGGNDYDLIERPSGPYLSGGVRFFLLGEAPTGLFLAPGAHGLLWTSWSAQEGRLLLRENEPWWGFDLLLGGAWRVGPGLYLSGGLGAMYTVRPPDAYDRRFNLLLPTARANVGWAF